MNHRMKLRDAARILAGVAMLASVSCRRAPKGSGPFADKLAKYAPMVEEALGRPWKTTPRIEVRTHDQVREFVLEHLRDSTAQRELAGETAAFHVLGLIPDTLDLAKFFVPLLSEQIIGYYDPRTKVLYVVDGAPEDYVGLTILHELVHALQDQYINLDSLEQLTKDSDRQTAMQAVIEGQATLESAIMMSGGKGNIITSLPGGWRQIEQMIREGSENQPVFASAPMVIQESLLFPYVNGADFVRRYRDHHDSPLSFDSLPQSTEQVLHDSAYFTATPDRPITVDLPAIPGEVFENNFGEFGTRLFFYQHLGNINAAAAAATGWGGDQYAVVKTPAGDGVVWVSAWDTPVDAAEVVSAFTATITKRFGASEPTRSLKLRDGVSGDERRFEAGGRQIVVATREIDGRTVVCYTDVPAGANAALVDLSKVTLH
jgi:hypothetical protein